MKNISKTIAIFGMSFLTIGAMAQTTAPFMGAPSGSKGLVARKGPALNIPNPADRDAKAPTITTYTFQIDYVVNDAAAAAAYSVTADGWFADQLNWRFTKDDTNKNASRENYNEIQQAIVAFDTLLDQNSVGYTAHTASMTLDTVWAGPCWYKNTSGNPDTLVFTIDSVNAAGYPVMTTPYITYTVALHKDVSFTVATPGGPVTNTFHGLNLDTGYSMYALAGKTLPKSPKFAVSVSMKGSKLDTFNLGFGFPFSQCSGSCGAANAPYANPHTYIGYKFTSAAPRTIHANSFAYGWNYYYAGNTTLPLPDGTIFDGGSSPHNYEWNTCQTACTQDTMYFYEQDYGIYASVHFTNALGISDINPSGLTVNQNYPNPFNKQTTINYSLVKSSDVTFTVYDITGRIIANNSYGNVAPGQYSITLSANTFSPGIYFYTFNVNGSSVTKKMVITQ